MPRILKIISWVIELLDFHMERVSFLDWKKLKIKSSAPARMSLQQTNQDGSIFFCSNKNWAQFPEIPQKIAAARARSIPLVLIESAFWTVIDSL